MASYSTPRRRGDGTAGWSQEITKEEFANLIQSHLGQGTSPVKALIKVMADQNISLDNLKSEMRRIGGFSNARYDEVAQFFGLDPILKGTDITRFELNPVYIPMDLFDDVLSSITYFYNQYGSVRTVSNEAGLSYFVSSILGALLGVFDGGLLNRPEFTMSGILSTSGRVEITIFAGPSCIVLIGELKYQFKEQDSSDILAQMLCEADGADYSNFKAGLGATPIYCLLADNREWRFYTVDFETRPFTVQRSSKSVNVTGEEGSFEFMVNIKNACGYLFSFLLQAYFNGLKAYTTRSEAHGLEWKRRSLDMWVPATVQAERACHLFSKTTSAHSPGDATEIFDEAIGHLQASLSWIPNRVQKTDLWNTKVKREVLVEVLEHIGLDHAEDPMETLLMMRGKI